MPSGPEAFLTLTPIRCLLTAASVMITLPMLEGARRGRGGGCLSGSGVFILSLNTWASRSAFSWLVTARFPHGLVRAGMRSWEVTPCCSLTRLHHRFGSSWLEDNILLLLSSHLVLAHFAACIIALHAARCNALFRWVGRLLYRCHALYLRSAAT